jgi:hypothetical protein
MRMINKKAEDAAKVSDEQKTTDAERTSRVYEALKNRFSPPKFVSVKEARIGTGHDGLAERRLSLIAAPRKETKENK